MPARIQNPTPEQLARRARSTAWCRRDRERKLAEANRGARVCQHRHGSGVCGGALEYRTDRIGRLLTHCPRCARRKAGLCRDCPRPVYGTLGVAIRCHACNLRKQQENARAYRQRNREERNARWRARYRETPAEQKAQVAVKRRLWRLANPDKVQRAKRREALRQNPGALEYHAKRRKAQRAELARRARERYWLQRGPLPPVHCRRCGAAITRPARGRPRLTCNACVPPSIAARRKPDAQLPPRREPDVAHLRLGHPCLACGEWIPTGRAKKCPTCHARDRETARALLSNARTAA